MGLRIGLRVSHAEALEPLRQHLLKAGCRLLEEPQVEVLFSYRVGGSRSRGREDFHLLYSAARQVIRTRDRDEVVQALWQQIQLTGGAMARDFLVLSSALVEWKGRGILVMAPARAGRTFLLRGLSRAGAVDRGDSLCPVDERGRVHPCPHPDSSGLPGPLPLAGVLWTRFRPGAKTRLRRLTPARACVELFKCCLGARQQPERTLQQLLQLSRQLPCWHGVRGAVEGSGQDWLAGLDRWFP